MTSSALTSAICQSTSKQFWMECDEYFSAGFKLAFDETRPIDEPWQPTALGQHRTFRSHEALRRAARGADLVEGASHTSPRGWRYCEVTTSDLTLTALVTKVGAKRPPRRTKYRMTIAGCNHWLQPPVSLDLFSEFEASSIEKNGKIGGFLTIVAPPSHHPAQDCPLGVYLWVPYSNLRGTHLYLPISTLISSYDTLPTNSVLSDMAWPKIKQNLKQVEDTDNQSDQPDNQSDQP